jgi:anthranilate synthase component II
MTQPIIIIDNYDSFSYNLYQLVQMQSQSTVEVYRNDAITLEALQEKAPDRIILSPGPGHPENDSDFGVCKSVILEQEALNCPVMGVCLGHQGIAYHLGGLVLGAPGIMHGKTSMIEPVKPSPLFEGLSNPFEAMRYHSLLVDEASLPDCLEITARDTVQHLPMALQHKTRPLFGIQFHPESIGTPEGKQLIYNFLSLN